MQNSSKPTIRVRVLGGLAFLSAVLIVLLFRSLAVDDFVGRRWLVPAYIAYFVLVVLWLHLFAFYLHVDGIASRGKGLSKRVPKYLDYFITGLLTVGVLQISFADEWLARYIDNRAGSKAALIDKIRVQAQHHLTQQCGKDTYFTKEYCDKLLSISRAPDLATYTRTVLFSDSSFLNHSIGIYPVGPGGVADVKSPIRDYVTRYQAVLEYEGTASSSADRGAWSWLTLLLLPAVVGLRALKTSLELFADLS